MKKRTLVLIHILLLCFFSLLVVQFAEEIVTAKQALYYALLPKPEEPDSCSIPNLQPAEMNGDEWFTEHPLIYHAGGQINGHTYTNSSEALSKTLAEGNCFIEIDFAYTRDGHLVCVHGWDDVYPEEYRPTLEEFLATRIQGKYTPMTAQDLITMMQENPQMYLITDTKETDLVAVIADLVELTQGDSAVLDRFIVQLYYGSEKEDILRIYPFADSQFILTTYKLGQWPLEIGSICSKQNICVVAFEHGDLSAIDAATLREHGFVVYEFTVNRADIARESLQRGISSFYTDALSSADVTVD